MKKILLFILTFIVMQTDCYKRECYRNYDPLTMRRPFYGRAFTYYFTMTDATEGLFINTHITTLEDIDKCKLLHPCIKRIHRRCRPGMKYRKIYAEDYNSNDVITCFVQLSKVDTDQLYADFLRFDPQTYLDELEFFQNALCATVAHEVAIMKKMYYPDARAQIYDILDLLNKYTS